MPTARKEDWVTVQRAVRIDTTGLRGSGVNPPPPSLCHQDLPPALDCGQLQDHVGGFPGGGDSNPRLGPPASNPPARAVGLWPKPGLLCLRKGELGSGADPEALVLGQARPLLGPTPKGPAGLWVSRSSPLPRRRAPSRGRIPGLDGRAGPRGAARIFPSGWATILETDRKGRRWPDPTLRGAPGELGVPLPSCGGFSGSPRPRRAASPKARCGTRWRVRGVGAGRDVENLKETGRGFGPRALAGAADSSSRAIFSHSTPVTLTSTIPCSQSEKGPEGRRAGGLREPRFPSQSWKGRRRVGTAEACVLPPGAERPWGFRDSVPAWHRLPSAARAPWASFCLSFWVRVSPSLPTALNFGFHPPSSLAAFNSEVLSQFRAGTEESCRRRHWSQGRGCDEGEAGLPQSCLPFPLKEPEGAMPG